MRVGIGYDIHRLKKGRRLVLGGVEIPFPKGLDGHSDADVLIHAVVDAVLGAAGAGDLGEHFPDRDTRWKNADSRIFLRAAREILRKKRLEVSQIDSVILAEAPKLGPFKSRMRRAIAGAFGIPFERVSVKAKTNEGLGDVGRGRAIACHAVASLQKIGSRENR